MKMLASSMNVNRVVCFTAKQILSLGKREGKCVCAYALVHVCVCTRAYTCACDLVCMYVFMSCDSLLGWAGYIV